MERICKFISIPIEIWEDSNLTWNEKILFCEIDSFTSNSKECFISNEYISKFLNVTETSGNRILSSLIKKGYVIKTKFDGRKRYVKTAYSFYKNNAETTLPLHESQLCLCDESDPLYNIHNNINNTNRITNKEIDTIVSTKNDNSNVVKSNAKSEDKIDYQDVLNKWREICPMLTQPRMLDAKRKKKIVSLLKNNDATLDDLYKCFSIIASSTICNGGKEWKATFDWIINDTKSCFNGLLEGKYSFFSNNEKLAYERIINGEDVIVDAPKEQKIIIDGIEYK